MPIVKLGDYTDESKEILKLGDYTDESKEILKEMGVDTEEDDADPCRLLLKYFIEVCLN